MPSPHCSQAAPATGQDQSSCTLLQSAAQPEPFEAPASHTSVPSIWPLPHLLQSPPPAGQLQPVSTVQEAPQPSPAVVLPSSQASLPRATPLPHGSQVL